MKYASRDAGKFMRERRVSVVGLGGGGCKVVDFLAEFQQNWPGIFAIDTDSTVLADSHATAKLQIGSTRTNGLGTGGDVNLGRLAAEDDIEMIRGLFVDTDLVFLVVGLGGGTGTGAAPVVLNAARDAGSTTLCFVTLPFGFEGRRRRNEAEQAISDLHESADALIAVPNERLFEFVGESSVAESFRKADEVLSEGISAIWKLITQPGFINLDFADLKKVGQHSGGMCTFGCGSGTGKNRVKEALISAMNSPMLKQGQVIADARSLLVSIIGGPDLALKEVGDIMEALSSKTRDDADVFMGTVVEEKWKNRVSVTIVASEPMPFTADKTSVNDKPDDAAEPEDRPRTIGRKSGHKETQTRLSLETSGRGRFKGIEPTIFDGEDLDIPTFVRRGITIEK